MSEKRGEKEARRCGRCQKILGANERRRGDEEFDEWLCNNCWHELEPMSKNNNAIIDEILSDERLRQYRKYMWAKGIDPSHDSI